MSIEELNYLYISHGIRFDHDNMAYIDVVIE